jgi:hypothetical protein
VPLALAGTGYGLIGILVIILLVLLIIYFIRPAERVDSDPRAQGSTGRGA